MTPRALKVLAYAVAVAVLLGVFGLYTRPELMISISEQVWACFQ